MPLTKEGIKIKKKFYKEYGIIKGNRIFYAYMNQFPKETKKWHTK